MAHFTQLEMPLPEPPRHIVVLCDCRKVEGQLAQKSVMLFQSIDPVFYKGECSCGKVHVRKVNNG